MAGNTGKKWVLSCLGVSIAALLFSLLVAEGVLRYLATGPMRVNHRNFYQWDELLGWAKKPNATRTNLTEEFRAVEAVNSMGIRGPDYSFAKAANEYRILVLGDSYAEGYTVDFDDLCSETLKSILNSEASGPYFQVINCGTVGYSTDQELLFYKRDGRRFNPDLVILMFCENDTWDNASSAEVYGKFAPQFRIEGDHLKLVPACAQSLSPSMVPDSPPRPSPDINEWLKKHWRFYGLLLDGLVGLNLLSPEPVIVYPLPDSLRVLSRKPDPEVEHAWQITESVLVDLSKTVEESGASLLVAYVPIIWTVSPDAWTTVRRKYGMTGQEWDPDLVEKRLVQICKKNAIECLPTISVFKERAAAKGKTGDYYYHTRDGHWNAAGHRLFGQMLAERIQARQERRYFTTGTGALSRSGR